MDIKVNNVTETGLGLTIPAYRNDVQREADVIEEILRVYGYNNIDIKEKLTASISNSGKFEDYKLQNVIGNYLASNGFFEMLSNSLTTEAYIKLDNDLKEDHNIRMLNPLSNDLAVMRQSLLFSGLESIAYNINRKRSDLKLFEQNNKLIKLVADDISNIVKDVVNSEIYVVESFLNILQTNSGTKPHKHLVPFDKKNGLDKQKYSLTYYVSVGDQAVSEPGILKLYDPDEEILPSNGTLVIIPSGRTHSSSYNGKKDRVMIGVNFYSLN